MPDEPSHEPSEITYVEYFHPARPKSLRHRARVRTSAPRRSVAQDGPASGENQAYVSWLLSQSMLADANSISQQFSGQGSMWQNPYANPDPRPRSTGVGVVHGLPDLADHPPRASRSWPRWGRSAVAASGDRHRRRAHRPGQAGRRDLRVGNTPSVDGHFDRISTQIDPDFGTEAEFRSMCGGHPVRRHDHR